MLNDFLTLIIDILLWLPRVIYSFIADIIEFFMSLLPSQNLDVQNSLSGWTGDILYFLTLFEIQFAITSIFTALIARFILRRIPFIG